MAALVQSCSGSGKPAMRPSRVITAAPALPNRSDECTLSHCDRHVGFILEMVPGATCLRNWRPGNNIYMQIHPGWWQGVQSARSICAPRRSRPTAAQSSGDMSDLRIFLHAMLFEPKTPEGRTFDFLVLLAIAISGALTMLDSVHHLRAQHAIFFTNAERGLLAMFTAEYMLRACVARPTMKFVCSFYGLVDLIATLPTLLEELLHLAPSQLRLVRVLRLLRAFRMLHAVGLEAEAEALFTAVWASRRKMIVLLLALLTSCSIMGTAVYVFEDAKSGFTSIPKSIYCESLRIQPRGMLQPAARCV